MQPSLDSVDSMLLTLRPLIITEPQIGGNSLL